LDGGGLDLLSDVFEVGANHFVLCHECVRKPKEGHGIGAGLGGDFIDGNAP
jgi:hypothetical protein